MFTLFGSRRGSGASTTFALGAAALAGSFYFSDGGDSKNAMFLCAVGAVLFGISWFLDRSYYKEQLDGHDHNTQMDTIYRELDEIREKIDCCKQSCNTNMEKEINELTRCVEQNDNNVHNYVNEQVRGVQRAVEDVERRINSEMDNLNVCSRKVCKKEVLKEG